MNPTPFFPSRARYREGIRWIPDSVLPSPFRDLLKNRSARPIFRLVIEPMPDTPHPVTPDRTDLDATERGYPAWRRALLEYRATKGRPILWIRLPRGEGYEKLKNRQREQTPDEALTGWRDYLLFSGNLSFLLETLDSVLLDQPEIEIAIARTRKMRAGLLVSLRCRCH